LHIKIGLVTQFFKTIQKDEEIGPNITTALSEILNNRPSDDKLEGAVFNGPQIDKIFADQKLPELMSKEQRHALNCLKEVCSKFLGNIRPLNHKDIIANFIQSFRALNINVTIKIHSLICHLDEFRNNCGDYSDEQGERFHQDFRITQERYNGKNIANGMGFYCYSKIRAKDPKQHKRQADYFKKLEYFYVDKIDE
jgi:hypothetical protein